MKNLIQPIQGQSRALAFGLSWHTILGEKLDTVAVKLAKKQRATHYTRGGSRSTVVGLLTLKRSDRKTFAGTPLFSAAHAFARACPRGVVAIRWEVPGGVWMAAASDGAVLTGTDIIYDSPQEAQRALDELRAKHPDVVVYGDGDDEKVLSSTALIEQIATAAELKQATRAIDRIPLPVWVFIFLVFGWGLLQEARQWFDIDDAKKRQSEIQAIEVDPIKAWQEVIENWSRSIPTQSNDDFKAILSSIGKVPVSAGRWDLIEVSCNPVVLSCSAQYKRLHLGDNLALIDSLPKGWNIKFLDLNTAIAAWSISGIKKSTLSLIDLPTDELLKTSWSTIYQRVAPALSDINLSSPQSVQVNPPIKNLSDGRVEAIPFPGGGHVLLPVEREIVLTGPLRSLYALNFPASASLTQLHVRRSPTSQADISNSELVATLTGKIYAK